MQIFLRLALIAFLALPVAARSQSAEKGESFCYQIEKSVNVLVDFTQTSCIPTTGRSKGSYSFLLLSSAPIFSVPAAKKAWLLVVVAVAGEALNRSATIKPEEIWFSDATEMKNRIAYVLPASQAKSLQRKIHADQITLDIMYREISKRLVRKTFPN